MPFNQHSHVWGSNSKGSFCLTCGHFQEGTEPEDKSDVFYLSWKPEDNVIWPTGKSKKDYCCD